MKMAEEIKLSGVPETMLQTLFARAKESKGRGAVCDRKAEELLSKIDYDFTLADKDKAMHSGVIARTIMLDRLTKEYLSKNPDSTVVNLACGLDTRCYRIKNYSHWYNLDLPETIEVRQKLLPENGKISQIAMSATDDWSKEVTVKDKKALIIIEGLTMYLTDAEVKSIFDVISKRFEKATVFAEIMNPMVVKRFKEKSIEGSQAKFTWGIKNGKAFSSILKDFRFKEEHSLTEGMAEFIPVYKILGAIPLVKNISNKIVVLEK